MICLCQSWVACPSAICFIPSPLGIASRAPSVCEDTSIDADLPVMTTNMASPADLLTALPCIVLRGQLVGVKVPIQSYVGSSSSQRVMTANSLSRTEWTVGACYCICGSALHQSLPLMRMALWASVTPPPYLKTGITLDDDITKVSVLLVIPCELQACLQ